MEDPPEGTEVTGGGCSMVDGGVGPEADLRTAAAKRRPGPGALRAPLPRRAKPAAPPAPVEYPESDGRPMSESTRHWDVTVDATLPLKERYRNRADVFVGSDLMMYYERDLPQIYVSPDVFVAFGVPREPARDIWKTWEEGKLADFVVEVTSKSTQDRDETTKRELYQRLGVREYWQFDPTGDYLDPILKGQRLDADGIYAALCLKTGADGVLYGVSEVLGLHVCVYGERLRYRNPNTGEYLPTADDHRRLAEAARAEAEAARDEAEALRQQLAGR